MRAQIELYFNGGEDAEPYFTLTEVEVNTVTELANIAYKEQRKQHAAHVSFGRAIERDADGFPDYGSERGTKSSRRSH